jgi:branched-chain amino acid transport system ATP-binding protein
MLGSILKCADMSVVYNHHAVGIENVSFEVQHGAIVALVGPNGAGKTTTLRAISGFLRSEPGAVSGGSITAEGHDLTGMLPHQVARLGIVLVPEHDKIFRGLSVEENLMVAPNGGSAQADAIAFALELFPVLKDKWKMPAGYLSGGERQMLAISMALANVPRLLLADELSQGIAPVLVSEIMRAVARINSELGVSVLLVEQNVRSALSIADQVNVIEGGTIAWRGSADDAKSDEGFTQVYMGLATSGH